MLITSQPPGAQVSLDGTPVGETSLKLRLLGGDHEMRVHLAGYIPVHQTIHVGPPDPVQVELRLSRGGSGENHRFTADDLGFTYLANPALPRLLPTNDTVWERPDLDPFLRAGFGWGALAGAIGGGVVFGGFMASTGNSVSGDPGNSALLGISVGASLMVLVTTAVTLHGYYSAPMSYREVPNQGTIVINRGRQDAWMDKVAAVNAYNKTIDAKLREANEALEQGRDVTQERVASPAGR